MPLHAPGDDDPIRRIPYNAQFARWRSRLATEEIRAIEEDLDARIDAKLQSGEDILTSSWLPSEIGTDGGRDWSGTPYQVIWDRACAHSWEQTGQCFGLFLWERMMLRPEVWHCMKCEVDGVEITGMTYFRCRQGHQQPV